MVSKHTTTALTVNESEPRLIEDIRRWLTKLAPPSEIYMHNDMDLREAPGAFVLLDSHKLV